MSTISHSTARAAPAVRDVVTAADLDLGPFPRDSPMTPETMAQPWLAGETVRYVGERSLW